MKRIVACVVIAWCGAAQAALETMDNHELQAVNGQAGADLSLELKLNHDASSVFTGPSYLQTIDGSNDATDIANLAFYRLGISVNKRFVQETTAGSGDWSKASSDSGRKLWLVFKGIQGTLNIQYAGLDGVDLLYNQKGAVVANGTDAGSQVVKPAIQLSFKADQPILIRNFGYNALSIETDSFVTNSAGVEGVGTNGYLKTGVYNSTNAPGSNFDWGRETGFTGLQMNGNLAFQGKVNMFSCDGTHPRC